MDYKLSGESTIKSSEPEERQRLRVEEGGVIKFGIVELFNDGNNLELFKVAVKLIHRNRCKTTLRQKAPADCYMFTVKKFHDTNAKKSKWAACQGRSRSL